MSKLKVDRSEVDKIIQNMEMFNATKEVLESYEAEKKVLEERGEELNKRLSDLQEQHTTLLMDKEVAKDNPSDYIYISTQLTKIDGEVKILLSLQEQQQEEFTELKKKYMPIIRDTYSKESMAKNDHFNVNEAVEHVTNELKQAISDYESEINKQDNQVMGVIYSDFLDDSELMDESWENVDRRRNALAFKRAFEYEKKLLNYKREIKL